MLAAVTQSPGVLAVDPLPARRCLATRLGAEQVAWGSPAEVTGVIRGWSRGEGPPRVIDTTGVPAALARAAIECVVAAADAVKVLVTIGGQAVQEERHE